MKPKILPFKWPPGSSKRSKVAAAQTLTPCERRWRTTTETEFNQLNT